ncbi:MAG: CTP synthase [Synergistaceae bacterium]|jgi:CTP synthase|nr:CTP synthase [Synergistaceae bacterium]
MTKFIFVTGGVVSSLGKGITAASLGTLLKRRGFKVSVLKMDPYLNVDAGTMNPFQHGEVFVTDDGAETDLDLGHYERFIDERLNCNNIVTAGKIYSEVISKERSGRYNGGTVQVIPHVTNEIQESILRAAGDNDVVIAEIGGTVGDIEGLPFLEAIRQMSGRVGRSSIIYCHVTLIPYIAAAAELKTKPTQHSVNELRRIGIQPDIIVCRSQLPMKQDMRDKIALFCSVPSDSIFEALDEETIYRVPISLHRQGLDRLVISRLGLKQDREIDLDDWLNYLDMRAHPEGEVTVALIGKYTSIKDSYLSVNEALTHAAIHNRVGISIRPIESEEIERHGAPEVLGGVHGILVPGGFGSRGMEGKIAAAGYARMNGIPYLGLCLGLQAAVIEFARNVAQIAPASSSEMDPGTPNPVIHIMEDQKTVDRLGGTMRLGAYPCKLKEGSRAYSSYGGADVIRERHRHRYEFNNNYRDRLEAAGLCITGLYEEKDLVEIVELPSHPWFVGVQFHPEFLSRPLRPHPLFRDFIASAKSAATSGGAL